MPPPEPRKDNEREMRQAIVEDADKIEDKDRDPCMAMAARLGSEKARI